MRRAERRKTKAKSLKLKAESKKISPVLSNLNSMAHYKFSAEYIALIALAVNREPSTNRKRMIEF